MPTPLLRCIDQKLCVTCDVVNICNLPSCRVAESGFLQVLSKDMNQKAAASMVGPTVSKP